MLAQLPGDARRGELEKARASWLKCILPLISLIFLLVIQLLHCSKILLLLLLPPIQIPSGSVIRHVPLGHPRGGAIYKGHGSPDAKHEHWLSWVHTVFLSTLPLAHSSALRHSLQAITKPLGGFPLSSSNNEAASFLSPWSTASDFLQWTATYQLPDTK